MGTLGLAYGLAAFCRIALHNIFLLYHVQYFFSVRDISASGFWSCELVFLVYNSLNDFVAGALSDRALLGFVYPTLDMGAAAKKSVSGADSASAFTMAKRIWAIKTGGPLFCGAFLLFWMHLSPWPTLDLLIALVAYDGLLSYLDVNHAALMVDLAPSERERANLTMYNAIFSCLASFSVFLSHAVWDPAHLREFHLVCVTLAAVCALGFLWSGSVLQQHLASLGSEGVDAMPPVSAGPPLSLRQCVRPWRVFLAQMLRTPNFMLFSGLHLLQVFHCHFNSNFFPLVAATLLGQYIDRGTQSMLLGLSFTLPHFNNVFFSMLVASKGAYSVIRGLLWTKVLLALAMLLAGPRSALLLCVFVASNRIFTEGTCRLLDLVVTDLVDEDRVLRGRQVALSALIFGTSALLSKPGQTLAPLLGTALLGDSEGAASMDTVFTLVVWVPIAAGLLQLAAWSQFTLHGHRLHKIQQRLTGLSSPSSLAIHLM